MEKLIKKSSAIENHFADFSSRIKSLSQALDEMWCIYVDFDSE